MDLSWTDDQMNLAQKFVMERFALNSVAGHLAPHSTVDDSETTVKSNRFDFAESIVIDREVSALYEPFSFCRFSKAQVDEFQAVQAGGDATQTKVVTTLTRAASSLARFHDVLFFRGYKDGIALKPKSVEMPQLEKPPQSLREAALEADSQDGGPISVGAPYNEGLVAAVYEAVLRLESRGYFTAFHLVLGQDLWQELHRPASGSMVLPRDRIEPTLMGGAFYRTTTLPQNEALFASLDGQAFECVIAGDAAQNPRFEWLRIASAQSHEEFYSFLPENALLLVCGRTVPS
jgi:uncharacterized linocin/CFP29 family protein